MNGKRPTRDQRAIFEEHGLNSKEYLVQKNTPTFLQVIHKETKEIKILNKE